MTYHSCDNHPACCNQMVPNDDLVMVGNIYCFCSSACASEFVAKRPDLLANLANVRGFRPEDFLVSLQRQFHVRAA